MFWLGFAIGAVVGGCGGVFLMALMAGSSGIGSGKR